MASAAFRKHIIKRFVSTQTNIRWPSLAEIPKTIIYENPPGSFSDKNDEAGRVDSAGCAGPDISRLLFHPVIELLTFSSGSLISVSSPFRSVRFYTSYIYIYTHTQIILYTTVRLCSRPTVLRVKDFCRVHLDGTGILLFPLHNIVFADMTVR